MNRALLPALIASIFAAGGAMAADQELLFGPSGVVKETPSPKQRAPKVTNQAPSSEEKPVVAKVKKPKIEPVEKELALPSVQAKPAPPAVKPPSDVAKAPAEPVKPAVAVTKPAVVEVTPPAPVAMKVTPPALPPVPVGKVAAAPVPKAMPLPPIQAAKPMPELKVAAPTPAAVVATPAAVIPAMPAMTAMPSMAPGTKMLEGTDPLLVRDVLIAKMDQETSVGFFPSVSGNGSSYDFLRHYLPLSNHLSQKTGVLVNLIPERSIVGFGSRIMAQQYPAIFVNATLAREASAAGYTPLVLGTEMLAAGYLVKADSPYKNIDDLKKVKIAWSRDSSAALFAMADLSKRDLSKQNTYQDIGLDTRDGAIKSVLSGAVNVSVMAFKDAQAAVSQSNGALRILNASTTGTSSAVWIRKDMVGTEYAKRMESAFLSVSPESAEPSAKQAAEAFALGFGTKASFVKATDAFLKDAMDTISMAKRSFPSSFPDLAGREQQTSDGSGKTTNPEVLRAAVSPVQRSDLKDTIAEREKIAKGMNQQSSVGFYPSAGGNGSTHDFLRNFLPLSNHLSQKTGVLINLMPERSIADYGSRIVRQQYPAVFINSILSRQAMAAGYVPVVVGSEKIAAGYLVKADSPFKTIDDLKKAKIGWSRDSQATLLAMADLAKRDLSKSNQYLDIGVNEKEGLLKALTSGSVSVAVMTSKEADAHAEKSNGALRSISSGVATESSALWLRKDVVGTDYAKRLESAFLSVSQESAEPGAKRAADMFANGFNVRGSFVPVHDGFSKELTDLISMAKGSFPNHFSDIGAREQAALESANRMSTEEFKNANIVRAPFEPVR